MLRVLTFTFLLFLSVPAVAQAAPSAVPAQQKFVLRSGQVTMCQIGRGCNEETAGGRKYLVMKTDGFVLRVASGEDRKHGYADITITNQTGTVQQVNPADFRMEEAEPKLHRLFYIDPNSQQDDAARAPKPAKSDVGKGLPPPSYWTSEEHEEDRKARPAALVNATVPTLRAGEIAPEATVSGRVYFERPRATSGVSVVIALPGALFEFPCRLVVEAKTGRHHKKDAVIMGAEAQS